MGGLVDIKAASAVGGLVASRARVAPAVFKERSIAWITVVLATLSYSRSSMHSHVAKRS